MHRFSYLAATLLALSAQVGFAQTAPATEPLEPAGTIDAEAPAKAAGNTILRIDLPVILNSNLDHNFWGHQQTLLPLLVSVERHFGGRISGVAEVLVNGGTPDARRAGLSLQGRYYFMPKHRGPLGLYVAPVISYRAIRQEATYRPYEVRRNMAGAGVLLGGQVPVGFNQRLVLDMAAGLMAWGKVRPDRVKYYAPTNEYYDYKTQYEQQRVMPDVRLGVGFRF